MICGGKKEIFKPDFKAESKQQIGGCQHFVY